MSKTIAKICAVLLLFSSLALASQDAMISSNEADVHTEPEKNSPVIGHYKGGEKVRISNYHKEGFYKVRLPDGKLGWLAQTDVAIQFDSPEIKAANIDLLGGKRDELTREYPWFFIRPMVTALSMSAINLGGFRTTYPLIAGGRFDALVRLDKYLRGGIRLGYYSSAYGGNQFFTMARSGLPVMLDFEMQMDKSRFREQYLVLAAGLDFYTISIKTVKPSSPEIVYARGSAPLIMAAWMTKWTINPKAWFDLELGGYFSPQLTKPIGDAPFLTNAGNPNKVTHRFSGPFAAIGFEFAL